MRRHLRLGISIGSLLLLAGLVATEALAAPTLLDEMMREGGFSKRAAGVLLLINGPMIAGVGILLFGTVGISSVENFIRAWIIGEGAEILRSVLDDDRVPGGLRKASEQGE